MGKTLKLRLFTRLAEIAGKEDIMVPLKGNPGCTLAELVQVMSDYLGKEFKNLLSNGLPEYTYLLVNGKTLNPEEEITSEDSVIWFYPAEGGT